jgi:uncharacterized OsmC-like protein
MIMLEYSVRACRDDADGGTAFCKDAKLVLDTGLTGRLDAFNPAELFLASVAACMLKGLERVAPLLSFSYSGAEINLHGIRQDAPPIMLRIDYEIILDTDESDRRLALMHENIRKYGTISNTVADALKLSGTIRRADV